LRWVAQHRRSENPDGGCHLSRPKSDLKAEMRSGSFNVIYITLGGFTLLGHFCELFEMLTAVENRRQIAPNSPQP
jgi:hypothetical protein